MLVETSKGYVVDNETGEIVGYVRPDGMTVWADGKRPQPILKPFMDRVVVG